MKIYERAMGFLHCTGGGLDIGFQQCQAFLAGLENSLDGDVLEFRPLPYQVFKRFAIKPVFIPG